MQLIAQNKYGTIYCASMVQEQMATFVHGR